MVYFCCSSVCFLNLVRVSPWRICCSKGFWFLPQPNQSLWFNCTYKILIGYQHIGAYLLRRCLEPSSINLDYSHYTSQSANCYLKQRVSRKEGARQNKLNSPCYCQRPLKGHFKQTTERICVENKLAKLKHNQCPRRMRPTIVL